MKIFSILFIATLFISCGSQKEVVQTTTTTTTETVEETIDQADMNYRVVGIVRENTEGCAFCIETEIAPGEIKFLYAVNLEDQFKKEGTKIKFDYALSRAMLPEGCKAEMTVSVTDVTRLRN